MGGRGTFASGNNVAYTYDTVDKIEGVKVLQGKPGRKGLPEEAHSSTAYIQLHPDGKFKMYREYDKKHFLRFEIGYHPETSIDPSRKPVLHVHEYKPDDFSDRKARPLTEKEYKKYRKFFRGI